MYSKLALAPLLIVNRVRPYRRFGLQLVLSIFLSSLLPMFARAELGSSTAHQQTPPKMACFLTAYPDQNLRGTMDSASNQFTLQVGNRHTFIWDDGQRDKPHRKRLETPDLEDTVHQVYPGGTPLHAPKIHQDPGRARVEPFLKAIYGQTSLEVRKNLISVPWMPGVTDKRILFNRNNGAAAALKAVSNQLSKLPTRFHKYVVKTAGTFNWRKIAGTERLSTHAFGIAIDLNLKFTDYWRWSKPIDGRYPYRNRIPHEIVDIFERHGFIWGGRWYHFDTMHFEYRPEFFQPPCRLRSMAK